MQVDNGVRTRDERFVSWLSELASDDQARQIKGGAKNRAILAALRRGLGEAPGLSLEVYPYLMQFLLPSEEQLLDQYTMVASLFALHPLDGGKGTLGSSLAEIRKEAEHVGAGAASVEKRFVALLNCHSDNLPGHLRHVISLAKSREVPINWLQLLRDIRYWGSPNRTVQRRWARDFWAGYDPAVDGPVEMSNEINELEEETV